MDRLTQLLLDAQQGDDEALERFVASTQHDVMAVCRYLGDRDNADDLAQETYRRAIASLHRFRAEGPARHWLLTIARRTCADATRRRIRRRRREHVREWNDDLHGIEPTSDTTGLGELIGALDPDRRAAFVLTQVNGLSYAEAADVLEVPIGTIRSRVARARIDLVGELEAAERRAAGELDEAADPREPEGRRRRPS